MSFGIYELNTYVDSIGNNHYGNKCMPAPNFQFSLSNYNDKHYRFITLGNDKIHRIANVDELYEALGYTNDIKRSGLLPDEFIWAEYRQPGSAKSPMCLQARIIEYLSKYSALFTEKYATQIKEWAGSCPEPGATEKQECCNCLLQPRPEY